MSWEKRGGGTIWSKSKAYGVFGKDRGKQLAHAKSAAALGRAHGARAEEIAQIHARRDHAAEGSQLGSTETPVRDMILPDEYRMDG
jgi:hypothetical protein